MSGGSSHQALLQKQDGNKYFGERKYSKAVECYTRAIKLDSKIPQYYTNRALCHLKLREWTKASNDCRSALEIDINSVKAYFFLGQAQNELENYDDACAALQAAYQLSKEQNLNVGDDLTNHLRQVKKKRWNALEDKRKKEESDLELYLRDLVNRDFDRKLGLSDEDSNEKQLLADTQLTKIKSSFIDRESALSQVTELFKEIDDKRKKREVPDYLCCKISFDVLEDPVVTPSGVTYSRKEIVDHLQRVGHFDPLTRSPLTQEKLIPNLSMRDVVEEFVSQNKWVDDF